MDRGIHCIFKLFVSFLVCSSNAAILLVSCWCMDVTGVNVSKLSFVCEFICWPVSASITQCVLAENFNKF